MKILIDISGTDKGLHIPIIGAINSYDKLDTKIILVGKKQDIESEFKKLNKLELLSEFEILECEEYISNTDDPAFAIKNKKTSNLVIAFNYMKENTDTILISASNTGALMAGGLLKLRKN